MSATTQGRTRRPGSPRERRHYQTDTVHNSSYSPLQGSSLKRNGCNMSSPSQNNWETSSASDSESESSPLKGYELRSHSAGSKVTGRSFVERDQVVYDYEPESAVVKKGVKRLWVTVTGTPSIFVPVAVCIVGLLLAMIFPIYFNLQNQKPSCSVEKVEDAFPLQELEMLTTVGSILKENEDTVRSVILLHSPRDSGTAECLARYLATKFACEKKESNNITLITPEDLNGVEDYGILVEQYTSTPHNAVVVKNLNKVSSQSAQIFHTLCDDTTLINPPSLYIFTIQSLEVTSDRPWTVARNILGDVWNDLAHHILDPLLNRIIGHVFNVKPEMGRPCDDNGAPGNNFE